MFSITQELDASDITWEEHADKTVAVRGFIARKYAPSRWMPRTFSFDLMDLFGRVVVDVSYHKRRFKSIDQGTSVLLMNAVVYKESGPYVHLYLPDPENNVIIDSTTYRQLIERPLACRQASSHFDDHPSSLAIVSGRMVWQDDWLQSYSGCDVCGRGYYAAFILKQRCTLCWKSQCKLFRTKIVLVDGKKRTNLVAFGQTFQDVFLLDEDAQITRKQLTLGLEKLAQDRYSRFIVRQSPAKWIDTSEMMIVKVLREPFYAQPF